MGVAVSSPTDTELARNAIYGAVQMAWHGVLIESMIEVLHLNMEARLIDGHIDDVRVRTIKRNVDTRIWVRLTGNIENSGPGTPCSI